jgi:hypothetical protein
MRLNRQLYPRSESNKLLYLLIPLILPFSLVSKVGLSGCILGIPGREPVCRGDSRIAPTFKINKIPGKKFEQPPAGFEPAGGFYKLNSYSLNKS